MELVLATRAWVIAHVVDILVAMLVWDLLTAGMSYVWRQFPEESRAAFAKRWPRLDAILRVCRKLGRDVRGAIPEALRTVTGRRLPDVRLFPPTPEPPAPDITEGSER